MEDLRDRTVNHFAARIQRAWRLNNPEQRRIHEETVYFWECMAYNFYGCAQQPDFGKSCPWPEYPAHLTGAVEIAYKIFRNWRAVMMVNSKTPAEQQAIRTKIVSYNIFHGQKQWPCQRAYIGNYLSSEPSFAAAQQTLLNSMQDQSVYFADKVNKVNGKGKMQMRGLVCTNRHMVKTDLKKFKQKKEVVKLADISRISLSPGDDTYVVINMKQPERDLVLDFGCGDSKENKVAEFVTFVFQAVQHLTGTQIPVVFEQTVQFNNTRKDGKQGTRVSVSFGRNPNPDPKKPRCQYKKLTSESGQILTQ